MATHIFLKNGLVMSCHVWLPEGNLPDDWKHSWSCCAPMLQPMWREVLREGTEWITMGITLGPNTRSSFCMLPSLLRETYLLCLIFKLLYWGTILWGSSMSVEHDYIYIYRLWTSLDHMYLYIYIYTHPHTYMYIFLRHIYTYIIYFFTENPLNQIHFPLVNRAAATAPGG